MSDKIRPQHVARKAILYVRQSSAYQVNHNLESQRLQYAMRDRLQQLGWREIDVVDDDLGRSAAGAVTRAGFERMVAEVCLGNVGGVAAPRKQLPHVVRSTAVVSAAPAMCCATRFCGPSRSYQTPSWASRQAPPTRRPRRRRHWRSQFSTVACA